MSDPNLPPYDPAGQPQQPYSAAPAAPAAPLTPAEDKQWASFAHFGGVLGILPPLIIWLVFKARGRLTDQEGKESTNFQITVLLAWVAYWILSIILAFIPILGWILIVLLPLAILAAQIVFPILGGVKVNGGGSYRYPFALRLIK